MYSEAGQTFFSKAIYFDTNAIRQLSHGGENVEFLNLRDFSRRLGINFFAPEIVIMEWCKYYKNEIYDELNKINNSIKKIEKYLLQEKIEYKEPQNVDDKISNIVNLILIKFSIEKVDTPINLPFKEIIQMAVFKLAPFEEKREKGFKDTIILFTIIEHMKSHAIQNAIFITGDSIFQHEDVSLRFKNEDLIINIAKNISDAREILGGQIAIAIDSYVREKKERILDFLEKNLMEIFDYVVKNAEISEDFIKGGPFFPKDDIPPFAIIKKILNLRPKKISNVFLGSISSEKTEKEGYENITFTIVVEFDLYIERYETQLLKPKHKLKLITPAEFDNFPVTLPFLVQEEITVDRTISIEAEISMVDDYPKELYLSKILTF